MTGAQTDVSVALQRVGLQRFDAYDGAEGLQSTALALLDASGDGVVVSAIQDAGSARVYVKRVPRGSRRGRRARARGAGRRGGCAAG